MPDRLTVQDQMSRSFDPGWAASYREMDAEVLRAGNSGDHYCRILKQLTASFGRQLVALDVGCGTGRYFHCLKAIKRLVGTDISAAMLANAQDPVNREQVEVGSIELRCGDVLTLDLPLAAFDFIYSIGVLGEYAPLDVRTARRLGELLAPGGAMFVTAVDANSRVSVPEKGAPSFTRRLARKAFPFLPQTVRQIANRTLSPYYVSRQQLEAVFAKAGFSAVTLTPYVHTSGWLGTHWDCLVRK
jgi:SAM-dependent methyltransferase